MANIDEPSTERVEDEEQHEEEAFEYIDALFHFPQWLADGGQHVDLRNMKIVFPGLYGSEIPLSGSHNTASESPCVTPPMRCNPILMKVGDHWMEGSWVEDRVNQRNMAPGSTPPHSPASGLQCLFH